METRVVDGTTERVSFLCFQFSLAIVVRDPETKQLEERSHTYVVTAASLGDLFDQLRAAARLHVEGWTWLAGDGMTPYLGSVLVRLHRIQPLEPSGRRAPDNIGLFPLLEWKCDHPASLEMVMNAMNERYERYKLTRLKESE